MMGEGRWRVAVAGWWSLQMRRVSQREVGTIGASNRRCVAIFKPISPKSTYLPTPNLGNFLVIWGKFLVNFKIRIFYIIFRVFYN